MSEDQTIQRTLALIKPLAYKNGHKEAIVAQIKAAGFTVEKSRQLHLTLDQAKRFYRVHQDKGFYEELCRYLSSGPIFAMQLSKPNAVADFRALLGACDPKDSPAGTLRALFGVDINHNAVHGSDAVETAQEELGLIF